MPSYDEIIQYLTGAWHMMMGRKEGLRMLDLSADGFWNSFFAIVVAVPPLFLSWVAFTNSYMPANEATKTAWLFQLALVDLAGWIVPLILLALAAKPAGIADRFSAYVVSTNWGSAVTAWLSLPAPLLRLFFPDSAELAASVGLLIFLVTLALIWRLTNAALDKGAAVATAVFVAMAMLSITIMVSMQSYLGLVPAGA